MVSVRKSWNATSCNRANGSFTFAISVQASKWPKKRNPWTGRAQQTDIQTRLSDGLLSPVKGGCRSGWRHFGWRYLQRAWSPTRRSSESSQTPRRSRGWKERWRRQTRQELTFGVAIQIKFYLNCPSNKIIHTNIGLGIELDLSTVVLDLSAVVIREEFGFQSKSLSRLISETNR